MERIDHASAVAVIPSPDPLGTPGYFTKGDAVRAIAATTVTQDWANGVQEELLGVIEGAGLSPDKGDNSQLLQAIQRLTGSVGNLFINSEGGVTQRPGTSVDNADDTEALVANGPDHWWFKAGGAGELANVIAVATTATDVVVGAPSRPRGYIRFEKHTARVTGENPSIRQSVEGVHWLSGQPCVVAFDARVLAGSDVDVIACHVEQDFGTGSADADVSTALTPIGAVTISSSWRRYIYVGTLPSIDSRDINGDAHLKVRVRFEADVTFDIALSAFVFSRGSADPGFIARDPSVEWILCERYYESNRPKSSSLDEDMRYGVWDTALALVAGDVPVLQERFRTQKYPGAFLVVVWYDIAQTANSITEGAATAHAVTSANITTAAGATTTGFPRITAPPAGGTTRLFRAWWTCETEISD